MLGVGHLLLLLVVRRENGFGRRCVCVRGLKRSVAGGLSKSVCGNGEERWWTMGKKVKIGGRV